MLENTATVTRAAIENLMAGLSEHDEVYAALVACQSRLNGIVWNRWVDEHNHKIRVQAAARDRMAFAKRHKSRGDRDTPAAL